jgi:hypothetical protein
VPEHAEAHCNLSACLLNLGRCAEALEHVRRGHELGSKRPGWPYPSAQWVREAEMRAGFEANLPALLDGKAQPKDNGERRQYVILCSIKKLHGAAAKLTVDLFAADPRLADDLDSKFRFNSAICAALAGTGNSEDASRFDDEGRAELRQLALDWLRADLTLHAKRLKSGKPEERAASQSALREWQSEAELACVRDPEALELLPEDDLNAFEQLWADVAALASR